MASPLEQFTIKPIVPISIGGLNLSYTNSALYMTIAVVVIVLGLVWLTSRRDMVPGRGQGFAESIYEFIAGLIRDNAGEEAMRYFPLIFSVFVFVAVGNVIGIRPRSRQQAVRMFTWVGIGSCFATSRSVVRSAKPIPTILPCVSSEASSTPNRVTTGRSKSF